MRDQNALAELLTGAGLRPTRQRLALAGLLFDGVDKHVTAEQVYADCVKRKARISLATVYNSLHHFTAAGLLHQVVIDGGQVFFDTNIADHHHIFDENTAKLTDIPAAGVLVSGLPVLPPEKQLARIDVVFRVRTAG
jgi:Fur family iron response transcriptional regulator